ncbi:hypothetical protein SELMODRAFT_127861 [Selaginella moellendorffii]|uniref:Uncharacterized protein n=1 Tax=Selaginella moellendorffii TaxID=88036 RepID=D8SYL3_SELML|nr:CSC1-like protein At4g35870 [Selaginella moellendorffii]EFJ10543.1 hypothetical protein SELMODRAFT_127861 [Selaginella moellendorffii]|eukprot:XP_002988453.1 CSC1-like protein At4g35870 [Selaginella moellendorffii]
MAGFEAPAAAPAPGDDSFDWLIPKQQDAWYGNIQYLSNISIIGAVCCVILFLVVKVRSDHKLPGAASLVTKLLAVWHTTSQQIARLCGANSAQYLSVEGYTFVTLAIVSVVAVLVILPVNLYGGTVPIEDQFAKATVAHVKEGSPWLWAHTVFMVALTAAVHLCTSSLEKHLQATQFHDGDSADSVAIFTLMVRGVPRVLAMDKRPLEDYFEHRYPGKVYSIVVPHDLDAFYRLKSELLKTRERIVAADAQARARQQVFYEEDYFFSGDDRDLFVDLSSSSSSHRRVSWFREKWSWIKHEVTRCWSCILVLCRLTPEDRLRRLAARRGELESSLGAYRDGIATGAGIAFVVFKDVFTASRALQDARMNSTRSDRLVGGFSMVEAQLSRGCWKVGRAPSPRDIYWHHLGRSSLQRRLRTVAVNLLLLLVLFFCSSPLAAITAIHNASRFIGRDTMEHLQVWLAWARSSNWFSTFILQFLPNVLIFVTMYVLVPACYIDKQDCKSIKQLMSATFLATSCLSALAFMITSSFLGVSFDLLAPIPWIKRKFLMRKSRSAAAMENGTPGHDANGLHEALLPENGAHSEEDDTVPRQASETMNDGFDLQGRDLTVYPLVKDLHWGIQRFDHAQYYAFNLTIFALVIVYSTFAPVMIPFGALYFGYRYMVDKYNFLFVYRVRGAAAANDGKLMGTVLRVMRLSLCLYLVAMLLFFYVRGDGERLQVLTTLALLMVVCAKYGIEKLVSPPKDGFDLSVIQGLRTVDEVVEGAEVEYEVLARPNFQGI